MLPNSRINPFSGVAGSFQTQLTAPPSAVTHQFVDTPAKSSFKDVMSNMVSETDKTLSQPDELMNRAMTTGDVDIHEVMIANTKADIAVNIASQVITRVVQAYERVQQIQV